MKLSNICALLVSQECNKGQLCLSLYGAVVHGDWNFPLLAALYWLAALPLQQRAPKNACCGVRAGLTHAVFHHHEAALITFKALALEISRRVDTPARPAYIQGDAALVDVCSKEMQQNPLITNILSA